MSPHPQFEEDLELYEIGVLDEADKAEIEAHLAECEECRAKLEGARRRLASLTMGVPALEASQELRSRILESCQGTRPAPDNVVPLSPAPGSGGSRPPAWAWLCAAACVALVVVTGWLALANYRLNQELSDLAVAGRQLSASNADLKTSAARAQAVLDVLTGAETVQVELTPESGHPVPHGKAFYNHQRGLLFYAMNLNSLPSEKTYELWLIPNEGNPIELGIFNTDSRGDGQVLLPPISHGLTAKSFAVTIEPAGGVPAPTGQMVLVGPVS